MSGTVKARPVPTCTLFMGTCPKPGIFFPEALRIACYGSTADD